MSAFLVNKEHIDAIVTAWIYLAEGRRRDERRDNATRVGTMLWEENNRSVNYRYGASYELPCDYAFAEVSLPTGVITLDIAGKIARLLSCYDYQSCEHPTWEQSDAWKLITGMREDLCEILGAQKTSNDLWCVTSRMVF